MHKFITTDTASAFAAGKKYVAAIGVFDGVHRGHRSVVECACRLAAQCGALPGALTFDPHPKMVVSPSAVPELLTPLDVRLNLLREAGAAACGIINFTPETAALEPEEFLRKLSDESGIEIAGITVGTQWRFGRGGRGDREVLKKFSAENGILFEAVPEMMQDGVLISSSAIRQAVSSGDLTGAEKMLGRKFAVCGRVVHGMSVAGSKLAAPTANLEVDRGILPPPGVYAAACTVGGKVFPAAVNIGTAPTFGVDKMRIEVHIIGFNGDLYDMGLTVQLNAFLRGIRKFSSADELKKQIATDIAVCRSLQESAE